MPVGSYCRRPARTITPELSVQVAAERMDTQRVGALVVVDGARPIGVVTDRDVALQVLAEGRDAASTTVGDLGGGPPATLTEDLSVSEASARMHHLGMRRMPVVEADGNVVGMLTVDDLVRLAAEELLGLADVASEQVPHGRRPAMRGAARNAMHYAKEVVSVDTQALVREVAERMRSASVGSVVVVDGSGEPVGIVTDRDLTCRVVAKGVDPATATASSIMSAQLLTVDAGDPLQQVARTMSQHGVRRIPVVRERKLVGIVTYDDVLVTLGRELHDLGEAAHTAISRERISAHAEDVRREVDRAVESLGARLEHLEEEARGAVGRQLDALRDRLGGD